MFDVWLFHSIWEFCHCEDRRHWESSWSQKRRKKKIWCEWEELVKEREIKNGAEVFNLEEEEFIQERRVYEKVTCVSNKRVCWIKKWKIIENKPEKKLISKQESKSETKKNTNK